jgi:uroporphyrinogen-III synthase
MTPPRRIWVTRTQPEAEATAQRLRAMGLQAVVAPVLEAAPLAGAVIDLAGVDAVAFTSGHAARAFAALCPARDLAVFTVGEATGGLARSAGFARVAAGAGDVRDLAALIDAATPRPRRLLAPTASEPAADLRALLAPHGVAVDTLAVYETRPTPLVAAPGGIDAVLIHSPKAARAVAALIEADRARGLDLFAISPAAAAPLAGLPFARVVLAARPDEAALLALLSDGRS